MARLNVTQRGDRGKKATIRVAFDISRRDLMYAALWRLEVNYGELARRKVCANVIANLTRAKVLETLRRGLLVRGSDLFEVAGENLAPGNAEAVSRRVEALFPEFD